MNEKIEAVGEKLDIDPVPILKSKTGINRGYWGVQAVTVFLAGIIGIISRQVASYASYPYESNINFLPLTGLNIVNGIITLPNWLFNKNISYFKRIGVFCGNLVLTTLVYVFFANLNKIFPNAMGISLRYGVYSNSGAKNEST